MRVWNWIKGLFGKSTVADTEQAYILPPVSGSPGISLGTVICRPSESSMILDAVALAHKVVFSQEFMDEVVKAEFTSTEGKSNLEIYQDYTSRQFVVNVRMFSPTLWQRMMGTVGYDSAHDDFVHANRYAVTTPERLAALIIHEFGHVLGYSHSSAREHTSVPYKMGEIAEKVIKQLKGKK